MMLTAYSFSHKGRAIFVHANILKHVEGIIEPGKIFDFT